MELSIEGQNVNISTIFLSIINVLTYFPVELKHQSKSNQNKHTMINFNVLQKKKKRDKCRRKNRRDKNMQGMLWLLNSKENDRVDPNVKGKNINRYCESCLLMWIIGLISFFLNVICLKE